MLVVISVTPQEIVDMHTALAEAQHLAEWAAVPTAGYAYLTAGEGVIRTWLGTVLGEVVSITNTRAEKGLWRSVRVKAANGHAYHGRGFAAYDLVHLHHSKRCAKCVAPDGTGK